MALDSYFGPVWHVVIGEDFTFNIDHEANSVYYILYGSYAILAWKVRTAAAAAAAGASAAASAIS